MKKKFIALVGSYLFYLLVAVSSLPIVSQGAEQAPETLSSLLIQYTQVRAEIIRGQWVSENAALGHAYDPRKIRELEILTIKGSLLETKILSLMAPAPTPSGQRELIGFRGFQHFQARTPVVVTAPLLARMGEITHSGSAQRTTISQWLESQPDLNLRTAARIEPGDAQGAFFNMRYKELKFGRIADLAEKLGIDQRLQRLGLNQRQIAQLLNTLGRIAESGDSTTRWVSFEEFCDPAITSLGKKFADVEWRRFVKFELAWFVRFAKTVPYP